MLSTCWLFLKDYTNKPGYVNKKNMRSSLENLKMSFLWGGGVLASSQCPKPQAWPSLPHTHGSNSSWSGSQDSWFLFLALWALPKCLKLLPNTCITSFSPGPQHLSHHHLQTIHTHRSLYSMTSAHYPLKPLQHPLGVQGEQSASPPRGS